MNTHYDDFILGGRYIAAKNKVNWRTPCDANGIIEKPYVWNLSQMAGANPNHRVMLLRLAQDQKTRQHWPYELTEKIGLDEDWQNLVKAVILRKIFIDRNKPITIKNGVVRPILALSIAANGKAPWEITTADIRKVIEVVKGFQPSGKLALSITSQTRTTFDQNRLSDYCPVTPPEVEKLLREGRNTRELRKYLTERKGLKKLPEEDAFYEAIRICWQETPNSSFDHARFSMVRLLVLCGIRISEAFSIPKDCLRFVHLHPSKLSGEVPSQAKTESLALIHFASKKRSQRSDSVPLFEAVQHVPDMFKDELMDTVNDFVKFSEPMRKRLQAQCETGRIFPEYDEEEIVQVFEVYARLTGEPFLYEDPDEHRLIKKWKETYDLKLLEEIDTRQAMFRSTKNLKNRVRQYFQMRLRIKLPNGSYERAPFLHKSGLPFMNSRLDYENLFFRIRDLESFLFRCMPSKISDVKPLTLRNGALFYPYQFLFLAPKRALAEERNCRICDIRKYAFVGCMDSQDLAYSLTGSQQSIPSLFRKYGKTDETRALTINSHSFRHLQNTELFRLGVSDAIITKRFNRNSVTQSHIYDHRSLAEDLKSIDLPEEAKNYLSGKAAETYRMIAGGLAKGHIVDEFRAIQKKYGDVVAYQFLMAEADGLHTTPYGHCINSFTVDPCPKHLECFSGCVHLTRSPLTEHTENLEKTRNRFEELLNSIDDHPAPPGAKEKMKAQAEERLSALDKMLATTIGEKVFPDGKDLSRPITKKFAGPFR